jgi:hypothetical protein
MRSSRHPGFDTGRRFRMMRRLPMRRSAVVVLLLLVTGLTPTPMGPVSAQIF